MWIQDSSDGWGVTNPWGGGEILLFYKGFAENCMKMKEIGLEGRTSLDP